MIRCWEWWRTAPTAAGASSGLLLAWLAGLGVLTFSTPDFSPTGKLIDVYFTFILLMVLFTAIKIPYSSLMDVITPDPIERTRVSS